MAYLDTLLSALGVSDLDTLAESEFGSMTVTYATSVSERSVAHLMYRPAGHESQAYVRETLGFDLPRDYAELLSVCNGGRFFHGTVVFYGYEPHLDRSKRERPIDIVRENKTFATVSPADFSSGYRDIGAIVAYDHAYRLLLTANGQIHTTANGKIGKSYNSVCDFLAHYYMNFGHFFKNEYRNGDDKKHIDQCINVIVRNSTIQ